MKISRERIQATAAVLFAALATALAFVVAYNLPCRSQDTPVVGPREWVGDSQALNAGMRFLTALL